MILNNRAIRTFKTRIHRDTYGRRPAQSNQQATAGYRSTAKFDTNPVGSHRSALIALHGNMFQRFGSPKPTAHTRLERHKMSHPDRGGHLTITCSKQLHSTNPATNPICPICPI